MPPLVPSPQQAQAPETVEVNNCAVGKIEFPNGGMALLFTIPGIRTYSFLLDANGRKLVASLCGLTVVGGNGPQSLYPPGES